VPLGSSADRYRLLSHAVAPFVSPSTATPQGRAAAAGRLWIGTGLAARVFISPLHRAAAVHQRAAAVRTTDLRLVTVARSFAATE
jgi:hypothetical protein